MIIASSVPYPYLRIVGDRGFLICSRNTEDMWGGRFPLATIS
jgi:hypothetical protein